MCDNTEAYLDEYVPVSVLVKAVCVQDLELGNISPAVHILLHKIFVRITLLRVLVEKLHVRVRRRRIQVVIEFLDIFAVITLVASYAEEAFLENGVLAVPKRQRKAETLVIIRYAGDTVLAPAVRTRTGVVMGEVGPRIAVRRVVLADGSLSK